MSLMNSAGNGVSRMGTHDRPAAHTDESDAPVSRAYAWVVLALIIGLMFSDYMSRHVIYPIFPILKSEWQLSDTQLGSLASVVALVVGMVTFPASLVADRWGRMRSATAMALIWGLATIACGLAGSFTAIFVARAIVGIGEAGYGSVGATILTHAFPRQLHSTVIGVFLAAALFGSMLGVALGGVIAQGLGWRMAFFIIGGAGLALAAVFPFLVEETSSRATAGSPPMPLREVIAALFRSPAVNRTYVASGLQMFVVGAVIAWAPSYLNRYYGIDPAAAAVRAGILVLVTGVGMAAGGFVVDRFSAKRRSNRLRLPALYVLVSGACLFVAFFTPAGTAQFVLIALGMMVGAGFAGPAGAVVADMTHPAMRATVFATLTLANNLIGLAPGPFVTGMLADAAGLDVAMRVIPAASIFAAAFFLSAARRYDHGDHSWRAGVGAS
jgi:predicted MFS family arabinose efflux permease